MSAQQFLSLPFLGNTQVHEKLGIRISEAIFFLSVVFVPDNSGTPSHTKT